jgi:molecular chaperone HtpG
MPTKRHKFKTEVQQLLNLVIHSLYTNREIFLRELISNASDAIDRVRFDALSDKALLEDDPEWKIKIIPDKEAKTLTVSDNGIGMTMEELDSNLGTIASSGTKRFINEMKERGGELPPELIGQFGVGFYSAFMVADKVTVLTRRAGAAKGEGLKWESTGTGSYTIDTVEKEGRGTDVVLHLKNEDDMEQFLEPWRIRRIVTTYSNFVEHPVVMDVEKTEGDGDDAKTTIVEETLNSRKAIWARAKNEVSDEEYHEFYKHVSHDFMDPARTIHWKAEGTTEFSALLYIPQKAPFDMFTPEPQKRGVHLYVKRVYITDDCEALVPNYLRFLRGVVDSSDLPLNVSRETLQEERVIRVMSKNIIRKVIDTLSDMMENDREAYVQFWNEFGRVIKEGVHSDLANREKLQDLLLFETTKTDPGTLVSLKEYVERMPESQKEIYYLSGPSRQALEKSPLLEAFAKRDVEVVFMTDPIDEWIVQAMTNYDEKPVKSIAKGDIDLSGIDEEADEKDEKTAEEYADLVAFLKDELKDKVKDIKVSSRLTESACCLVSGEMDMGVHMEKILKALQKDVPTAKRILEINPEHDLIRNMESMVKDNSRHLQLKEFADILFDQAALTAGLEIEDPSAFAQRISRVMAQASAGVGV